MVPQGSDLLVATGSIFCDARSAFKAVPSSKEVLHKPLVK